MQPVQLEYLRKEWERKSSDFSSWHWEVISVCTLESEDFYKVVLFTFAMAFFKHVSVLGKANYLLASLTAGLRALQDLSSWTQVPVLKTTVDFWSTFCLSSLNLFDFSLIFLNTGLIIVLLLQFSLTNARARNLKWREHVVEMLSAINSLDFIIYW